MAEPPARGLDDVDLVEVFDRSARPMLVADDERRYVDANDAACALLGLPREAILAGRIDDFVAPAARADLSTSWRAFLRVGELAGTFEFLLPSGRSVRARFAAVAHVGPHRHLTILVASGAPAPAPAPAAAPRRRLSGRERQVLQLLATGADGPQIAEALFVAPATVRTHINNAMRKLGARTRAHAIAIALRDGLLEI